MFASVDLARNEKSETMIRYTGPVDVAFATLERFAPTDDQVKSAVSAAENFGANIERCLAWLLERALWHAIGGRADVAGHYLRCFAILLRRDWVEPTAAERRP